MRPRVTSGGRLLLVQSEAAIPAVLALAAEQLDLEVEVCRSRDACDEAGMRLGAVIGLVVEPDSLTTLPAIAEAQPSAVRVLFADDRTLPLAVEVLNAAGALSIGRLDGGASALCALLQRAFEHSRVTADERRMLLALRTGLEQARLALAQAEVRAAAARGSIDVDSGLWDTMRLIERIEDEANRFQRYGTPFGVLGVGCVGAAAAFEQAVGALLEQFVRRVDVCTRRGPGDFVVVCPNTDVQGVSRLVDRFIEAVESSGIEAQAGRVPVVVFAAGFEVGPVRSDDVLDALGRARLESAKTI